MFSLLFHNRWFAVGWAVLTLASVSIFVGRDGGAEQLARSAEQLRTYRTLLSSAAAPMELPSAQMSEEPAPVPPAPLLLPVAGSSANQANPRVGDVFVNPVTGQKFRAVRRQDPARYRPAFPTGSYSSSAASP
jgi:hypothetical protein